MKRITGIVLIAISAAAFGSLAIFGRYAYADGIDVFTLLFLRFSLSAVLIGGLLILRHEPLPKGSIFIRLVGMGAIGYVGQSFSYLTAIKFASSGLVALLLYLYPLFVALLSSLFLREKITRAKTFALALALVGTALTVNPEGGQLPGILLAIFAAVIYSIYIIVGAGVMQKISPLQSSTVIFASAGVVYGILMTINKPHFPSSGTGWAVIAGVVIIATVIPVVAFLAGLKRIGPTNASMLSTLEPVVTVILAAILLHDTLKPAALLGGGLILAAVVLLTRSEMRQNN